MQQSVYLVTMEEEEESVIFRKSPSSTAKSNFHSNAAAVDFISTTTAAIHRCSESDDGSFFDIEFTTDEDQIEAIQELTCDIISPENVGVSPSDDLVITGHLVPLSGFTLNSSYLLKSASKFVRLKLKLKKSSKSITPGNSKSGEQSTEKTGQNKRKSQGKLLTVPILSLFARDGNKSNKSIDEKRGGLQKSAIQRYMKKVKPKLGFSGQNRNSGEAVKNVVMSPEEAPEVREAVRRRNLKRGSSLLKQSGKGRSAAVAASPMRGSVVVTRRRDDSLIQEEDGIQSAIMHCKRSFDG